MTDVTRITANGVEKRNGTTVHTERTETIQEGVRLPGGINHLNASESTGRSAYERMHDTGETQKQISQR